MNFCVLDILFSSPKCLHDAGSIPGDSGGLEWRSGGHLTGDSVTTTSEIARHHQVSVSFATGFDSRRPQQPAFSQNQNQESVLGSASR